MTDRVRAQLPNNALENGEKERRTTVIPNRTEATGLFQGWGPKL